MADKAPEQEPSIEEILASIRQIISDDEDKDSGDVSEEEVSAPAPKAPEPEAEPVVEIDMADLEEEEEEDDVLELTDPVPDETPAFEAPAEKKFDIALQDPAPELPEEPAEVEMESPKFEATPSSMADDILTEAAKSATISSMAKLAGNMPITKHRDYGNITLEDLVREMLHPMLRDWLSDNLPPMVERMVQKELEKLSRRAMDD